MSEFVLRHLRWCSFRRLNHCDLLVLRLYFIPRFRLYAMTLFSSLQGYLNSLTVHYKENNDVVAKKDVINWMDLPLDVWNNQIFPFVGDHQYRFVGGTCKTF